MTAPRRQHGIDMVAVQQLEEHRQRVVRTCQKKKRFADEYACRAMGLRLMEREDCKMYIYLCRCCRGWHMTSQEQPAYFAADYLEKKAYK